MSLTYNVVVIGGCGFLGSYIVDQLIKYPTKECEFGLLNVSVIDIRIDNFRPEVQYHQCDITDKAKLKVLFDEIKPDIVIHTASPVHTAPIPVFEKVNVQGTQNALEVSNESEYTKVFVYTSSSSVVYAGQDLKNADETIPYPLEHTDPYNRTKAEAEEKVLHYGKSTSLLTCALRPSGLFGPGDRQMLPGFLEVLDRGQTKIQLGDNENLFDFTYIENVAYSHLLACKALLGPNASKVTGQAFFITNDEPMYFWTVPRAIWAGLGHVDQYIIRIPIQVCYVIAFLAEMWAYLTNRKAGLTRARAQYVCTYKFYNIKKAKELLNYRPLYTMNEGLQKSIDWLKDERAKRSAKKMQ